MSRVSRGIETEFGKLVDLSPDAVCITGFDGYLKRVNPALCQMLGYTQEELLSRPFMNNVYPEDWEMVEAAMATLARGDDILGFECRQLCADGSVRWIEWNTQAVPADGVVYAIGRDVTDRHRMNEAVQRLADEQAALRRVATLVARGAPPQELFAAAVEEVGRLLRASSAALGRYEPDGMFTSVAAWSVAEVSFPMGRRWTPEGKNLAGLVLRTGRPARLDDFSDASGPIGVYAREAGIKSAVGAPITVEGRLWGMMTAASTAEEPLPAETETRLVSFTELIATAIANADSRSELAASRRRIVAASDGTRRRIERDLHDGTQQRLVSLGLAVRAAEANVPPDRNDLRDELSRVATGLADAVEDLQEISRGIHPAILSKGGLAPALEGLAHRSPIPVNLELKADARLPEPIEVAAYYVASEALANAAKHAQASQIEVSLASRNASLVLSIRDDGVGGAYPGRGSGLVGLQDRVEALGGTIKIDSSAGSGTCVVVTLPIATESDQEIEDFLGPPEQLESRSSPARERGR